MTIEADDKITDLDRLRIATASQIAAALIMRRHSELPLVKDIGALAEQVHADLAGDAILIADEIIRQVYGTGINE